MEQARPKVGVGLLLIRGDTVLLGKRKSVHAQGEYGGPSGHLEHLESFEDAILRETAEEAGPKLKIKNLRFLCVTNLRHYAPKHYIDIGMVAEWAGGEPVVMEPDRLESWGWHDIDRLPEPLFSMVPNYLKAYRDGTPYFND